MVAVLVEASVKDFFCFPPTLRKDSFQGLTPLEEGRVEATERL